VKVGKRILFDGFARPDRLVWAKKSQKVLKTGVFPYFWLKLGAEPKAERLGIFFLVLFLEFL